MVKESNPSVHIYHLLLLIHDRVYRQLDADLRFACVALD